MPPQLFSRRSARFAEDAPLDAGDVTLPLARAPRTVEEAGASAWRRVTDDLMTLDVPGRQWWCVCRPAKVPAARWARGQRASLQAGPSPLTHASLDPSRHLEPQVEARFVRIVCLVNAAAQALGPERAEAARQAGFQRGLPSSTGFFACGLAAKGGA